MKTDEQWRPIKGYEGLYEVSSLGRVKSLNYNHTGAEKIMKPGKDKHGYLLVQLCKDGKIKGLLVHRLVAAAFIPNPNNYPYINHKDETPLNNCIKNLEWCTAKYNTNYGSRNKKIASALSKPVEASKYEDFREICLKFASTNEAGRNGYCQCAVSSCCNGRFHREGNNKYKNLYWRYAV